MVDCALDVFVADVAEDAARQQDVGWRHAGVAVGHRRVGAAHAHAVESRRAGARARRLRQRVVQLDEHRRDVLASRVLRQRADHVAPLSGAHAGDADRPRLRGALIQRRADMRLHDAQPLRQARVGIVVRGVPLLPVGRDNNRWGGCGGGSCPEANWLLVRPRVLLGGTRQSEFGATTCNHCRIGVASATRWHRVSRRTRAGRSRAAFVWSQAATRLPRLKIRLALFNEGADSLFVAGRRVLLVDGFAFVFDDFLNVGLDHVAVHHLLRGPHGIGGVRGDFVRKFHRCWQQGFGRHDARYKAEGEGSLCIDDAPGRP